MCKVVWSGHHACKFIMHANPSCKQVHHACKSIMHANPSCMQIHMFLIGPSAAEGHVPGVPKFACTWLVLGRRGKWGIVDKSNESDIKTQMQRQREGANRTAEWQRAR